MKQYFYLINYPTFKESLCKMEMKYLFNQIPDNKYILSEKYISPSRSPFIKESISVIYSANSVEEIASKIVENNVSYENFKVYYLKIEGSDVNYEERLSSIRKIGLVINGESKMQSPDVTLGLTKVEGKWIFGIYEKNDYEWHIHDNKPYSYSNSLSMRVSRALVNIAVGNNKDCRLVDPCCGVGTVVIEALSMGFNIKGYEINPLIAENAKKNIEFFGYDNVVENKDMHTVKEKYDVAIIDIPYGLFTPTTIKEQTDIINTGRNIADKMVIVTFEDMDKHIIDAGFKIVDRCYVCKGKFKRYINICE